MLDLSVPLLLLSITSTWNAFPEISHQSLLGKTQDQCHCPPGAFLDSQIEGSLAHSMVYSHCDREGLNPRWMLAVPQYGEGRDEPRMNAGSAR